jgi:hypothetical protein
VEFVFDNIKLKPKAISIPESMGFIKYGIKLKPGFTVGNKITNTGYIYFDYNAPIITNTTTTVGVSYPLTVKPLANSQADFKVAPNPTFADVQIENAASKEQYHLQLFDCNGQLLLFKTNLMGKSTLSLSQFNDGIYLLKIISKFGTKHFKLVKRQ